MSKLTISSNFSPTAFLTEPVPENNSSNLIWLIGVFFWEDFDHLENLRDSLSVQNEIIYSAGVKSHLGTSHVGCPFSLVVYVKNR